MFSFCISLNIIHSLCQYRYTISKCTGDLDGTDPSDVGILLFDRLVFLHIGWSYCECILSRLTLRVAADVWRILYRVFRDGILFLAVLLGFWGVES